MCLTLRTRDFPFRQQQAAIFPSMFAACLRDRVPALAKRSNHTRQDEARWFSVGIASNGAVPPVVYKWSEADPRGIRLISAVKQRNTIVARVRLP